MKVAVDVDVLVNDRKTGVYYYNQRLLAALLELDKGNDYTMAYFGRPQSLSDLGLPEGRAKVRRVGWFPRKVFNASLRTPFGLPFDLLTGTNADVYLFAKFVRWPLWRRKKSIVFVYDTAFIDFPEVIETRHFRWYLNREVPRSLETADQVVVVSESTKNSLIRHYGTPESRITVVTPAIDHEVFKPAPQSEINRVKAQFGIAKTYILSVSTIEPRKNLVGLLRAFAKISPEISQNYALVLAGGKGWLDDEINEAYDELSARMTIIRTGYVAEEDLPVLYAGASVFAFPSLFEGFGMPPLEAMACGTPVVVADNSSLPEVVGDAGVLVDAKDTAGIARAIEKVLQDPKLAESLRERGLKQAAKFRWELSAKRLLEVINKVGAKQ